MDTQDRLRRTEAVQNMKELRPGSSGRSEIRILFAFDPRRSAVPLVAGDKAGRWEALYDKAIPLAEERFAEWVA
ncbi:Phage derived protein Gp49-like [Streptosporangium canum]|uniref:Phage derived protein Gp49-like n=1 Tax=Streptosporangium canum TaxID=324952 RepID=A0A1I4CPV4_9ACTN|nr:Phage derived protein Gp49-like [Streptosporangium canum]